MSRHAETVSHNAVIREIRSLSTSVKELVLEMATVGFDFQPGQWVDFNVAPIDEAGGFSMTSTPASLRRTGCLTLAVKRSSHPMTHWVHERAVPGDQVHLHVGGSCFYRPSMGGSVVLIGGGIGITPLWSIARHVLETIKHPRVDLIHGARLPEDLIFKEEMRRLAKEHSDFNFFRTVSQPDDTWHGPVGRIDKNLIKNRLNKTRLDSVHVFLCGPRAMTESLESFLPSLGIPGNRIHHERWW